MKLNAVRPYLNDRVWFMKLGRKVVAKVYMDYLEQVDEVVLMPGIALEDSREVLKIVASHAYRYVVDRRNWHTDGILKVGYRGVYSSSKSSLFFSDRVVSRHITEMDMDRLTAGLLEIGVKVIWAQVGNLEEAISEAIKGHEGVSSLTFYVKVINNVTDLYRVVFTSPKPLTFRAWKSVGKGGDDFDLYIVPDYHPDTQKNKHSIDLVNGDTDALIGGRTVRSVFCPCNPGVKKPRGFLTSSWRTVNHPFHATGPEVTINISPTLVLSKEGIEEVRTLLIALLELDDTYLSVSGGFSAPYDLPVNVANNLGLRTRGFRGEARGSEGHCVWAYKVLREEGELDNAYVPDWFRTERWLEAYGMS